MDFFKRHEKKYLLTPDQYDAVKTAIKPHMAADSHGTYLVQNIYFDTDNWDVIRKSIEKPIYKEKMRLRCYGLPETATELFLELKKKYKGVVYKRRISFSIKEIDNRNFDEIAKNSGCQVGNELAFYLHCHNVYPRAYISYRREAFFNQQFRLTFDTNAVFRSKSLNYTNPSEGKIIFPNDKILMEIKTPSSIPLWLTGVLSAEKIYPHSFSKYGAGYTKHIIGGNGKWTSSQAAL